MSIQSSDLAGDMNTVQLGALRPYVNMSNDRSRHEFCLDDGTSVADSMLFKTYISKAEVPGDIDSDLPILTIYFQKVGRKGLFAEASDEMKEHGNIDTKTTLTLGSGKDKPVTTEEMASRGADISQLGLQESFLDSMASVTAGDYLTPAELDEMQWNIVLSNCNAMHGWKFDLNTMSVKRAPQPAFKLRKGLNLSMDSESALGSQDVSQTLKSDVNISKTKGSSDAGDTGGEEVSTKKSPAVPFLCKRKKPDAIPSFCVVDDSKVDVTVVSSTLEESMAKNNFTGSSFEVGGSGSFLGIGFGGSMGTAQRQESGTGNKSTDIETLMVGNYRFPRASVFLRAEDLEPTESLAAAIEKVRITKSLDQLKALYDNYGHFFCEEVLIGGRLQTTRVTTVKDTYSMSRAKSQFKTEVGAAISIPLIASINTKYSKESGNDQETSQQQTNSRDAIAFEATGGNTILATNPPLWTESVLDYRNWRVIERSGLTPLGHVLGRCSAVEVKQARTWFSQAVPSLSKYIAIPESRVIQVRLKLNSKIPQLSHPENQLFDREVCHYLGHQYSKCIHPVRVGLSRKEYVPQTTKTVTQFSNIIITDITTVLKEEFKHEEISLFTPARFHAPVALPYHDIYFKDGVTEDDYRETVWNMIVPYGEWLQQDSLVMLTSASGIRHSDNVWLTVFRNAQGHLMPAMTSSGDASFWRVRKVNTGRELSEGDTIKLTWRFSDQTAGFRDFYGDSFGRRTFSKPPDVNEDEIHLKLPFPGFQRTAGRDQKQEESAGLAMIMSVVEKDQPFLQGLAISSKAQEGSQTPTYNLHDVTFRIDLVGNAGLGELKDYMTRGLNQSLSQVVTGLTPEQIEGQETQRIIDDALAKIDHVGIALFGSLFQMMSSPAKMIISKSAGFYTGT